MKMRLCLLIVFFCLANIILFAQDNLTLSLELVKPSGKIDNTSYFAAKLQNHNDTLGLIINQLGEGFYHIQWHSFMRVIYGDKGKEQMRHRQPFFWYGDDRMIWIKPDSTWIVKLPLFFPLDNSGNGIIPPAESVVKDYRKVRIKLEKLTFWPIRTLDYPLPPKKIIDLYSNWVDVPCEEIIEYLHNR